MGCAQSVVAIDPNQVPYHFPKLKSKKSSNYSYLQLEETETGVYVISPRTKMKLEVTGNQDFLTHHLHNELCLSPYATAKKIRARQIIQHYMFNDLSHKKIAGALSTTKLTEFALKAWFQRTFLNCLENAEDQYFNQGVSYDSVQKRIAEEYIFEIYKMGEFINAGLGKFGDGKKRVKVPLSLIMLHSDSALYPLLTRLQEKYPLVQQNENITYPDVKNMTQNINLLKLIDSKCYSDPQNLNIQTTFDDLKYLIDQANDLFADFKTDMIHLLGAEALTDCKVKRSEAGGNVTYNASSVRRVFIKWSETLIERIPDTYLLEEFLEFLRSKKKMADNFIFKSIISETTHQQVIKCLSQLLESMKYKISSTEPRQEFGLFLYDLLRCKTTRSNGDEIVSLLEALKNTKVTASGKLFEVVRIKNRFKYATRDILINFRYGEHLVGEAQLCIDSPHDSPQITKRIKFRHYLYELQRGLFGPTFELIMQYEDFARKDIQVNLQAVGKIRPRQLNMQRQKIKKAERQCPQRHEMVSVKGNLFDQNNFNDVDSKSDSFVCDFCFETSSFSEEYHYCYYCTVFYCLKCLNVYNNTDFSKIELSCDQNQLLTELKNESDIKAACSERKGIIIIAYKPGRPASRMFLDQVIYLLSTYISHGRQLPKIFAFNASQKSFQNVVKKYQITKLPTTLLLNEQLQALLTLVGSTFHDIEGFFEVLQQRIKNGLPKGIKIKCGVCNEPMSSQDQYKPNKDQQCQNCMNTNKIQDTGDFIRACKISNQDFVCKNGHIKCGYCSYLSSNSPSYYRDHTGKSYLSNNLIFNRVFCLKSHAMKIVPQTKPFKCDKCQQEVKEKSDNEVAYCSECESYTCTQCLQTSDNSNYKEQELKQFLRSVQIVSHFVEDQAQEARPCGCGNRFLKVYQSKRRDKYRKYNIFKDILMRRQQKKWVCYVCKEECYKLKLHLACFYCQYAKAINKEISHIQICMNCCMKSGLINAKASPEVKWQNHLKCQKGHSVTHSNNRQENNTHFECVNCKGKFYSYTQRYECKQCDFKCCRQCSSKFLIDPILPITKKTCKKSHLLQFKKQNSGFQFCNECQQFLQDKHFKCNSDKCRYFLCTSCAEK